MQARNQNYSGCDSLTCCNLRKHMQIEKNTPILQCKHIKKAQIIKKAPNHSYGNTYTFRSEKTKLTSTVDSLLKEPDYTYFYNILMYSLFWSYFNNESLQCFSLTLNFYLVNNLINNLVI